MSTHEKLLTADNPVLHQRAKAMRQEMSEAEAKLWFWNHEILQQTNDVLAEILRVLQELEKQYAQ